MTARRRHEKPLRRVNPSGKVVWVARWTDRNSKRQSAGTFEMKREAQDAIDAAYEAHYNRPAGPTMDVTVGQYAENWTRRHPRTERTDRTYDYRVRRVLDIRVEGVCLRDWPMGDVRPRLVVDVIDCLLREQKRSAAGAVAILRTLSAMWRDGIRDDATHYNPWRDATIRASDPRIVKPPRRLRVYSWEQMHAVAAAAPGVYGQAMIRALSDCGLRLGEMLALERADLRLEGCADANCKAGDVPHAHVRQTAYEGNVEQGTKTTRGQATLGRVVPMPDGLIAILHELPPLTRLLFPSPRGKVLQNRCFYKDIWYPARAAVLGMGEATPHQFRHSWVTHMRAAGIDIADVAAAAGHTVETATAKYTHPLERSFGAMIDAIG